MICLAVTGTCKGRFVAFITFICNTAITFNYRLSLDEGFFSPSKNPEWKL